MRKYSLRAGELQLTACLEAQLPQLGDRRLRGGVRLVDEGFRGGGVVVDLLLREAQGHRDRDEPGLHAGLTEIARANGMSAAAIDACFERLDAHRVFARLDALNHSSIKVCERIGMTRVGLSRDYYDEETMLFVADRQGR